MIQSEESSSFLKKRTKKLLLVAVRVNRAGRLTKQNKSFLFLFFKKELLPSRFTRHAFLYNSIFALAVTSTVPN
jgi:hypothetical protein